MHAAINTAQGIENIAAQGTVYKAYVKYGPTHPRTLAAATALTNRLCASRGLPPITACNPLPGPRTVAALRTQGRAYAAASAAGNYPAFAKALRNLRHLKEHGPLASLCYPVQCSLAGLRVGG